MQEEPDYGTLKKGGFMRQVQKDRFSLRLRVTGGRFGSAQLRKVSEVAERFGQGYVHFTCRQGVEIPFIALEDIAAVKAALAEAGVSPGSCGPRVRTVTACQGSEVCPGGLINTSALAAEMDARYFGAELPHKFKIGVTGCPNNCLKAEENDLGVKGAVFPAWKAGECVFCGLCEGVCPARAILVDKTAETLSYAAERCAFCGKCVKSCPASAWEGKKGYLLFFGGSFGNEIKPGAPLFPPFFEKPRLFKAADAAVAFYREQGKPGERFGKTIARVGRAVFAAAMNEKMGKAGETDG
ncbi:MAG: 4Fe-4S binding protein [Treponema sp.]|jgi:dissimilatory sulfite reductase (desulfoviridin) alpha/beta subunit|nr:4Fe-4S binding protein [Treponema sp.]